MDHIKKSLEKMGLGDHEAAVYAILLEQSPLSATLIAKKCQLSRSSVYTTLSLLIAKGLVGTSYKNDIKQFIAEDPHALEQLLLNEQKKIVSKLNDFQHFSKQVSFLQQPNLHIPNIIIFEGQEGLKRIYRSMMRNAPVGSTFYLMRDEFIWQPEWAFVFETDWHSRVKKIKQEKQIHTKLLVNDSKIERSHKVEYQSRKALEYRFLPKTHVLKQFAIYIVADMVSILSFEQQQLIGIQITNLHIAKNMQKLFEMLWKSSKQR